MSWNAPNEKDNSRFERSLALLLAGIVIILFSGLWQVRVYRTPARVDVLEQKLDQLTLRHNSSLEVIGQQEMRVQMLEAWAEEAIGDYPYNDTAKAKIAIRTRESFERMLKLYNGMPSSEQKHKTYDIFKNSDGMSKWLNEVPPPDTQPILK